MCDQFLQRAISLQVSQNNDCTDYCNTYVAKSSFNVMLRLMLYSVVNKNNHSIGRVTTYSLIPDKIEKVVGLPTHGPFASLGINSVVTCLVVLMIILFLSDAIVSSVVAPP